MCGIAGIVQLDGAGDPDRDRLERMGRALGHRGPDDAGIRVGGGAGLVHRRLAILDPAHGRQPMGNGDGTVWIAYNGEIYNHADLRPELAAAGHAFRTRCDTETLLHLYERYGPACVERLRGMFAFAVWDERRRRLVLARDRLGIKPLYWATAGERIVFGSEIKAILASGLVRPAFRREVVPEYLANRFVAGEETFFEGVRKLLPGRMLTWSPGAGVRVERYWSPVVETDERRRNLEPEAAEVRDRLADAVRSHLMSDVPLGLFLSGGIDSSALAGLMAPMARDPIRTFSVGFDGPGGSEFDWAAEAARAVGAEHRTLTVTPREFLAELPRLVWHEDEPIAFSSSVPLYFVSRLASEHVKVVLTGEGADELFLGYNRYRVTAWNARLARVWRRAPGPLRKLVVGALERLPGRLARYAGRSFLTLPPEARFLYFENFSVFPAASQARLLADPGALERHDPYAQALACFEEGPGDVLDRMSRADLQTYLVELLMKQDQMSMAASIESRVPFLDTPLVEHVARLPSGLKIRNGRTKAVLRAAVRDLVPRSVLERPKMGFPVPFGRWLAGEHARVVDELVLGPRARARGLYREDALRALAAEHRAGAVDHGERLWLLANLEIWQRIHVDGEDPSAIGRTLAC